MTAPAVRNDIGSDFELVTDDWLVQETAGPPWEETAASTTYLSTGRQALRWIASLMWAEGRRRLLVPAHHCESMVTPFSAVGMQVVPVAVDAQVCMIPEAITSAVGTPTRDVVLEATYFGGQPGAALDAALVQVETAGVKVVVDATHRLFEPARTPHRVHVASLRKLLPLPDGAFFTSPVPLDCGRVGTSPEWLNRRLRAMQRKSQYIDGRTSSRDFRQDFLETQQQLEELPDPVAPSPYTMSTIRRLAYSRIADRRRANRVALLNALTSTSYCPLTTDLDLTPAYVVLSGPDITGLRAHLAARRIYCPIHWPPPPTAPARRWRTDLISLPVDHRYGDQDMHRLAEAVNAYVPQVRRSPG